MLHHMNINPRPKGDIARFLLGPLYDLLDGEIWLFRVFAME
jgi:hypothetical protein